MCYLRDSSVGIKIQFNAELLKSYKVYQILTYKIVRVVTHLIHILSLRNSLIFIIQIYYIYFIFYLLCAWYVQQPTTLWIQIKLYKNAYKLRSFFKNSSGSRLANFTRSWASLPRTYKDKPAHCCTPIIDGKKIPSRTPKCNSRKSWAHNPNDSKSNPLVCAYERQANRESSLIVGRGHICWLMVSLLALSRQKQLTKSSQQCKACLFQDCLSQRNVHSAKTFSEGFPLSEKWDHEKTLAIIKFCCTSIYLCRQKHVLNGCSWEMSPKGWPCKLLGIQLCKKS